MGEKRDTLTCDELSRLATTFYYFYCDKDTFERLILTNTLCLKISELCIDSLDIYPSNKQCVSLIRGKFKNFFYNHKWHSSRPPSKSGCYYHSSDRRFANLFACRRFSRKYIFRPDILIKLNDLYLTTFSSIFSHSNQTKQNKT